MLFVAKVLYLLEPDSGDKQGNIKEDMEEQEVLGDGLAREDVEEHKVCADKNEERSEPATLLWLIRKLSRIAKLEAAYSPRNPLKVRCMCKMTASSLFFLKYFNGFSYPPKSLGTFEPRTAAITSALK